MSGWSIPASFVRAVLKGHSLLGLALAAPIFLVCLTGTLAVFAEEFRRWENPGAPRMEMASTEALQSALSEAVRSTEGKSEHVYLMPPAPDAPWLQVISDVEGDYRYHAADAQGELTATPSPWTTFVTELHIRLHLPNTIGLFIVGLSGVALLSSLISGLLAHPRIFRDAFHLRLGGNVRLQEADLHNRLGVWGLPFHIVVSLTGALLGLTTLIVGVLGLAVFQGDANKVYDLFLPPHPAEDTRPAPVLNLAPMLAHVAEVAPGARIEQIAVEHPLETGGAALFSVEDRPQWLAGTSAIAFDRTGAPYHTARVQDNNAGVSILGSLGPLHFGWFGGGLVKVAYGILGLGLTYLTAGGVLIWLHRSRAKGKAAPGWERVWSAFTWGQCVALAGAMLAAIVTHAHGTSAPLLTWGALSILSLLSAIRLSSPQLTRLGMLGTGGLLLLTAVLHVALRGVSGLDAMSWVIDLVCVAAAAALIVLAVHRSTRPATTA